MVAVIGPNGAGKTTLVSTIAGLLKPASGRVELRGEDVTGRAPDRMLRKGVALVPERRRIFAELTVTENLLVGGVTATARERRARFDELIGLFPILADRRHQKAGHLSGGEAQQLAIARALMSDPQLLVMDEPALGLAPALVDVVMSLIAHLRAGGRTVLVVEQNVRKVLAVADRAYVLRTGRVAESGPAAELAARDDLFATFVGGAPR